MKHLMSWILFEGKIDDCIEDIKIILTNISDYPNFISSHIDGEILVFSFKNLKFSEDELDETNGRLLDIGWSILTISGSSAPEIKYISIIKDDLKSELESKGVKLFRDLEWGDWFLNKSTNSNCLYWSGEIGEYYYSIIDGVSNQERGINQVNWIEIICDDEGIDMRFISLVDAEIFFIEKQLGV